MYEETLYTQQISLFSETFTLLQGALKFYESFVEVDPKGRLVIGPATSPETR